MQLNLDNELFIVTGATSGFGKAIALQLIAEGAHVIINARGEEKLKSFQETYPNQIETVCGDITTDATISSLLRIIDDRKVSGMVINSGGPPAMSFQNTRLHDWDKAYQNVLRWKVKLTHSILPRMQEQKYGRLLYLESSSVKQPIDNLVLSNSLRLAVVGFVKTLSQEIAKDGITLNILAPGYHSTPAMQRLFTHKSMLLGITPEEAKNEYEAESKVGILGNPTDLATLAVWILSPLSKFVTGQTISIDGGLIKGTLG
jgi:3-oxoacyl-[acyl-carrier protein] reductase